MYQLVAAAERDHVDVDLLYSTPLQTRRPMDIQAGVLEPAPCREEFLRVHREKKQPGLLRGGRAILILVESRSRSTVDALLVMMDYALILCTFMICAFMLCTFIVCTFIVCSFILCV